MLTRLFELDARGTTVVREVQMGTLLSIPLRDVYLSRPLGIIFRRGKELGKTARRFMQMLQETTPPDSPANGAGGPAASVASGNGDVHGKSNGRRGRARAAK